MILKGYLFGALYGVICLLLSHLVYKLGVPKIYTRKLVHILVGFEWVILYVYHGATVHFLAVCLAFTALLAVSYYKKLLPMISSESDNSPGTVYYGISMSVMALVCLFIKQLMIPFGIAVFATSVGDGLAGVVGQAVRKFNPKIYGKKSLFGTLANLLGTVLTVVVFDRVFEIGFSVWQIAIISVFAVELELFTFAGLDNITLPIGVFFLTSLMMLLPTAWNYIVPILLTPVIVALVKEKRLLTPAGICVALVLDIVVSVTLGNFGFTLLLVFLCGGSLIDLVKRKNINNVEKKSGPRDQTQVLANATVSAVCALMYSTVGMPVFAVGFSAGLAEALADTASSGFGSLAKRTFDPFRMKKCEKGLSGGMSVIGTLSAAAASAAVGGLCVLFGMAGLMEFVIITVSGFLGCVFDSLLGSLFQIKYKCRVCGKITESPTHCDTEAEKYRGVRRISNDLVNLLGTAFAAGVSVLLYILIM